MNLFGLLMEVLNQYTTSTDWTPFWFGCFAGLWPWIVALMYFLGGGNYDKIPDFVYGVFVSYAVFFNTFPINMVLQYRKVGRWADYRYGELCTCSFRSARRACSRGSCLAGRSS